MKRVVGFLLALVCAVANISFAQFVWTKNAANPVFNGSGNGTWDKHVFGSTVLYNSDSARYEMWYIGSYGPEISWHPYRIGFAWSTDGVNWTKYAGNPVLVPDVGRWDEHDVQSAAVLREGSGYKMWYSGIRSGAAKIGLATSVDGIHWTKYAGNPVMTPGLAAWEAGSVGICAIIERSGGYAMWYTGRDASLSEIWRIGRATSIDGITWQKDTLNNPVLSPGSPGQWDDRGILTSSILKVGSTLYLSYTGWRSGYLLRQVGMATSTNEGITWTKHASNPIVSLGAAGSWDASYIEGGAMLLRGETTFHMWYTGSREPTGTYLWRIGHATSPRAGIVRRVPSQYATIQSAINASAHGDTVLVAEGLYYENIRYNGKRIVVGSQFIVDADTSHISRTIINGSFGLHPDSGSVVYFTDGEDTNSVLCGFTITGGSGTYVPYWSSIEGGGVLCLFSGARLVRNIITGNNLAGQYLYGGGVAADTGTMLIMERNIVKGNALNATTGQAMGAGVEVYVSDAILRENVIADNTATTQAVQSNSGGGGVFLGTGTFVVHDNLIARNKAFALNTTLYACFGGGVLAQGGNLDFRSNRLTGNLVQSSNSVRAYGGGVCLLASEVAELGETVVAGNYIASNSVIGGSSGTALSGGGGIFSYDHRPRIENNIIVKNSAPFGGGFGARRYYTASTPGNEAASDGIGRGGARSVNVNRNHSTLLPNAPILINNTIAYNRATSGNGGGIATTGSWTPKVINSILWGDTASTEIYVQGGGIRVLYSNVTNGWPSDSGNIDVNPQFTDSTYKLANTSGCLERGVDSTQIDGTWYKAPPYCITGIRRPTPADRPPDIGACENPNRVTGVDGNSHLLPLTFALEQNYPNPFNPSTTINYQLPTNSHITLKVFDILGREVATIVNEVQDAGFKSVTFDASNLASGVYLYRLNTGNFASTRKMALMK